MALLTSPVAAPVALPALPRIAPRFLLAAASLLCAAWTLRDGSGGAAPMLAIAAAAMASSIAGFAFSAICGALLFHLSGDTVRMVQIMITCSVANQAAMTWSTRHDIDWRTLRITLAGGGLGLAIGVWVLLHAPYRLYTGVLGGFLLLYGGFMLRRRPRIVGWQQPAIDFAAGFLGGITGGAAGFPGAFVTIWCGMKGWDKARQRAVFQPFILLMQVAALLAIGLARQTGGFDAANLLFVPASLLGTSLGLALYRRMSDSQFARAVNLLLIVSGLSYLL